jgi:hypothetical protein
MRLKQQWFKNSLVRLDLSLQFGVFLGTHPRLLLVGEHIVEIHGVTVGTEERSPKAAFLPVKRDFLLH